MRRARVLGRVDVGQEHGVDERRLAQSRLADDHQRELEALLDGAPVDLVGQVGEADVVDLARLAHRGRGRRGRRQRLALLGRPVAQHGSLAILLDQFTFQRFHLSATDMARSVTGLRELVRHQLGPPPPGTRRRW